MRTILKLLSALVLATGLISTSSAAELRPMRIDPYGPNVRTIISDRGGYVIDYAIRVQRLLRSDGYVRFAGRCDSACTLFLAMPKTRVCITPDATFGFHLPYGASPRGNLVAARFLMKNYPDWVRAWIQKDGGLKSYVRTMTYAEASRFLPTCAPQSPRTTLADLSFDRVRPLFRTRS